MCEWRDDGNGRKGIGKERGSLFGRKNHSDGCHWMQALMVVWVRDFGKLMSRIAARGEGRERRGVEGERQREGESELASVAARRRRRWPMVCIT